MTSRHITQGEYATGSDPDAVISTLLGSCVSCCLWDPNAGVGGMNHIVLAKSVGEDRTPFWAGVNAMEILINALIKFGADRNNLKAKAFGGAQMVTGLSDIGPQNADFTVNFLAKEGIPLITKSFGGTQGRNLKFWPTTGRVMQKLIDADVPVVEVLPPMQTGRDVELF